MSRGIVVGLVGVLALAGCYKSTPAAPSPATANTTAPPAQPLAPRPNVAVDDPVGFLPIDSEAVIVLDGEQLRTHPLWSVVEQKLRANHGAQLATFSRLCGTDPVTTIRSVSIGMRNLRGKEPDGVIVIRGLSRKKLTDCIESATTAKPAPLVADRGVYTLRPDASDPRAIAFTFVDDSTAVMQVADGANHDSMAKLIAAHSPLRRSPTFTSLLAQVETTGAVWFILNGNSSLFDAATTTGTKPTAAWGAMRVDHGGVALDVRLRFADPATAQTLATQAQGQLGMAQSFFDRFDIGADGAELVVAVEVSESKLTSILGLLGVTTPTPTPAGGLGAPTTTP